MNAMNEDTKRIFDRYVKGYKFSVQKLFPDKKLRIMKIVFTGKIEDSLFLCLFKMFRQNIENYGSSGYCKYICMNYNKSTYVNAGIYESAIPTNIPLKMKTLFDKTLKPRLNFFNYDETYYFKLYRDKKILRTIFLFLRGKYKLPNEMIFHILSFIRIIELGDDLENTSLEKISDEQMQLMYF